MPTVLPALEQHRPAESLMLETLRTQVSADRPLARFFERSPGQRRGTPRSSETTDGRRAALWTATGWLVLHSVGVGSRGPGIDHVLIGPAGIVTVNTKTHRCAKIWVAGRTFMVNGQRQPCIRDSQHEAERVRRALARTPLAEVPGTP